VEQDHLRGLAGAFEVVVGAGVDVSVDLGTGLAQRAASDRIADPGIISLPDPDPGFLPVESLPHAFDVRSIASAESLDSENTPQRREPASFAATGRSDEWSEADRDVALSRDQYFASHQARRPVAWSTQSAASQVRRHVDSQPHPKSYANKPTPPVRAAWLLSPATCVVAASLSRAFGESLDGGTTGPHWSFAASESSHFVVAETGRPADMRATVEPRSDQRFGELAASGKENNVRDLLIAPYEPLSILVGVSVISAQLIADSRLSDKKASRAATISRLIR
jgi:hypothetical protein